MDLEEKEHEGVSEGGEAYVTGGTRGFGGETTSDNRKVMTPHGSKT
jgi:hypothetical protein